MPHYLEILSATIYMGSSKLGVGRQLHQQKFALVTLLIKICFNYNNYKHITGENFIWGFYVLFYIMLIMVNCFIFIDS